MSKKFNPVTPSLRTLVLPSFDELDIRTKGGEKSLLRKKKRISGRNNNGHITCRHRGGGHKRKYRIIDFVRSKENILAKVASIEYDPNRSAFIALLHYADGEKSYILAPQGLRVGDKVQTSDESEFDVGCCMRLKKMPVGSIVHNIEIKPGRGGKLVRSAGLSAQLLARREGYAAIKMPSGEIRLIHENCRATFGILSNFENNLRVESKAGRKRWRGVRPTVRGVAMNPIDHPHGGGEGRSKGNHPKTPWSKSCKGKKTRCGKKSQKWIIKKRKKKKKLGR